MANISHKIGLALVASALSAGCLFGLSGCSDSASASLPNDNDTHKLAQASAKMGDRPNYYTPDVSKSGTIPYTVHLDGDTVVNEDGEEVETEATEYTVEIAIDPFMLLWNATGTIVDIDYSSDLAVVRLSSFEDGHFVTPDVLISYADYLAMSEYDLTIGSKISFQYLLTKPMHTPLQAYNITFA